MLARDQWDWTMGQARPAAFERFLRAIESRNRGWLKAGNCPRCRVYLDGVELERVVAVHRGTGRASVVDDPLRVDKRGKRYISRTLRGRVEVELINGN